ncbi:hypothetical protein ASPWEDRAFT_25743 [Aspergillus wentii DTO 134E9]|uniref:ribonuclease T1 n=1 Tax=Aspergillus wentii DTO 134E9 TaxID=1073089 RepID=A0A1L9RYH0_ASPWE|nr:uncharacterized protein ASPWEDRAFT_25743 [Aspergillus wentii DTO 134E9]KAI9931378.1 hypothetical protein MW887_009953 [Aspergillus wentii]OJJ39955.1 hypothetical protein ASPWEDRAFT_25743 [Aspergillus wentii DTO 134E9]
MPSLRNVALNTLLAFAMSNVANAYPAQSRDVKPVDINIEKPDWPEYNVNVDFDDHYHPNVEIEKVDKRGIKDDDDKHSNVHIEKPDWPEYNVTVTFDDNYRPDVEIEKVDKRGKKPDGLSIDKEPSGSFACPATDRYSATTYTANQAKLAFVAGAKYAYDGKQVGHGNYPHIYGNREDLPFNCGRATAEFVIDRNDPGEAYDGADTRDQPDRVVFEWNEKRSVAKFCGIMRHGNNNGDFVLCGN